MLFDPSRIRSFILAASFVALPGLVSSAGAQDAGSLSCNELWYKRNQIYARNGYCFNTARARAVFGEACFPPYGRLSGWEKRRVQELQTWERRRSC